MEKVIKSRLKVLLLQVIKRTKNLPKSDEYYIIKRQLIRSTSSSGANYNAVCRAKPKADFIYKLKIVIEELDETYYWMDILNSLDDCGMQFDTLMNETNELLSIMVSSLKTSQKNHKSKIP